MRVTAEKKAEIKERILHESIPFLKKSGLNGAPVDQIMKHIGLTSGALYSHFESKDDLFAQALLKELDIIIAGHEERVKKQGAAALPSFIEYYLSNRHVQEVARGCVFVSLGADIHRQPQKIKAAYQKKVQGLLRIMAQSLPGSGDHTPFVSFVFSSLIGAVVLARSMSDTTAAQAFLIAAKQQLMSLVEQNLKGVQYA